MTCDFCGVDGASPMSIPNYFLADNYSGYDPALHPWTGNVCRKCIINQLARASHGRLVKADPLHLFNIAAYMLAGMAIGHGLQHEVEGTVTCIILAGVVLASKALLMKLEKDD